jgi:hypothetical protein
VDAGCGLNAERDSSLATKVPALGLNRTVRRSDWAGAEEAGFNEHASSARISTAWRVRSGHVLPATGIKGIQSRAVV